MSKPKKQTISNILVKHFTRGCGDWRAYERAKQYIDELDLNTSERDEAISMITDFLGV